MTQQELHAQRLVKEAEQTHLRMHTRRHFLRESAMGLGALALGSIAGGCGRQGGSPTTVAFDPARPLLPKSPPFLGKAKSVIYLHMAGAPSQLELFDYKPELAKMDGQDCPESLLKGKKFAFITGVPKMLGPQAEFAQHGQSGAWISNHLPHLSTMADEITFLKAVTTDQFNHAPAQLLMHTGSARLGRPSMGSWVTLGWAPKTKTCLALWYLPVAAVFRMQEKACGAAAFCPVYTRGCNAAAKATRFCSSKIRMA
jgi:Protein of unknown function (DUF1501)